MANFNPGLNPSSDPDYSKDSRLDQGAFVDRVGAMAVENGRKAIGVVAKAADSIFDTANWGVEKAADNALREGVETVRDEQGGDVYGLENQSQNRAQNPGMAPPAIGRYAEGVTKLQAQYDQGVISDSRYYEQLEVLTRQVKARFPGYTDHIDQTIRHLTGVTPANALREARMAEMKATASESQRKAEHDQSFFRQNIKYLRPDWQTRSADENYEDIRVGQRSEEDINTKIKKLDLQAKEKSVSDDEQKRLASSIVMDTANEYRRVTQPIIDEAITKIESGKSIDPTEAEGLAQAYEFNLRTAVHEKLAKMNITGEEYNRLMGMAMEDTKLFRQTMISGDAAMLKQQKLHVELMGQENYRRLYDESDLVQKMEMIKHLPQPIQAQLAADFNTKITGPLADKLGLKESAIPGGTANPDELPKETKGALGLFHMDNVGSYLSSANRMKQMRPVDQLKRLGDFPNGKSANAIQSYVNDWVHIMTNDSLPDEVKKGAIDRFFKEDNMDFLKEFKTPADKQAVFRAFTSPTMVAEMQKHKGPQYDQYSRWVKQNFHHVFKSEIDLLADVPNRPFVNLDYNESTGKFLLVPTEEGRRVADEEARKAGKPSLVGTMNAVERLYKQAPLEKAVNELNASLDSVKPLVEGEGFTFNQEVKNLIHFEAIHDTKNATLWQSFLKNSREGVKKMEEETFGGQNINFSDASGGPRGVMEEIAKGESGSNYNRLVDTPTHPREIPLTTMTVREVLNYQKGMLRAGNASSAAGKYQIVSKTLKGLVDKGHVTLDDKFDEATQDKLANILLEGRGYKDYLEGRKPLRELMAALGKEWEIIKVDPKLRKKVAQELAYAVQD